MSKFIEKLKHHTQITPAPLGFGKAPVQEKPRILLAVYITDADVQNLADCVSGADVAVLALDSLNSIEVLPKLSKVASDILWGGWLKNTQPEKTETKSITADFLIFSPETSLFETPAKLGRILEIDTATPDTQLRAIDDLPVEAVLVSGKPDTFNWQYLIALQRLDNLLAKPLLVVVSSDVTVLELQTLWSVGVDGVVIEPKNGGKLKLLREEIEKAAFPLPRKSKKVDVMIPFISPAPAEEPDEEEDE
jgi:hypothetical protein